MMRLRTRTSKKTILLFSVLILVTVGYAYLTQALMINGTSSIDNNTEWNIHFEDYQATSNSTITPTTPPDTTGNNKTTLSYALTFDTPGQVYEFTVDTKNGGTIDALIRNYASTIKIGDNAAQDATDLANIPSYLTYSVTYADDVAIEDNHLLAANTKETIKVHVEFNRDISNAELAQAANKTIKLDITVNYEQTDGTEQPVRITDADFTTDSWETIIAASQADNPTTLIQQMENGTTRPVTLNLPGEGDSTCNLRIVNISTPAECETAGFSESACGLVLECANSITTHIMNPEYDGSTGTGNIGGWASSSMRTYLNSTIYNAFPTDLRTNIITTHVVSGHETGVTTNYTSTDSIYLLSTKEVGFELPNDTLQSETRTLDYYSSHNNNNSRIRQYLGSNADWCLRSVNKTTNFSFYYVQYDGTSYNSYGHYARAFSPVFRIGDNAR